MKTFKPDTVSLLHKTYEKGGKTCLTLTAIINFPFDTPRNLRVEEELWKFAAQALPRGILLSLLMPKAVGEVFVIGKCFSPRGTPAPACKVNVKVGGVDKTLYVFGKRRWKSYLGAHLMSDPEPFTVMEISPENAFGGEGYALNPRGRGYYPAEQEKIGIKELLLPNVEHPQHLIATPHDTPPPAGYFPASASHPRWQEKAGTYDEKWLKENWPYFAPDMATDYFNTAPRDQRLNGYFRGDEKFEIRGMHPGKDVLSAALPGLKLRCFAARPGGQKSIYEEIDLNIDTLWLFPDRERGFLVYHGTTVIADDEGSDLSHIYLEIEPLEQPRRPAAYEEEFVRLREREEGETAPAPPEGQKPAPEAAVAREKGLPSSPEDIAARPAEAEYNQALANMKAEFARVGIDLERYADVTPPPGPRPASPPSAASIEAAFQEATANLQAFFAQHGLAGAPLPPHSPPPSPAEAAALLLGLVSSLEKTPLAGNPLLKEGLLTMARELEYLNQSLPPLPESKVVNTESPAGGKRPETAFSARAIRERYKRGERDFSGLNLEGFDFSGFSMPGVVFRRSNCDRCVFSGASLEGSDFSGVSARQADFSKAGLGGIDFTEADLAGAILEAADLRRALLTRTLLDSVQAGKADFSGADLKGAVMVKAAFPEALFPGVQAAGADFTGSDLKGASFEKAELSQAVFSQCLLKGASFAEAVAADPDFTAATAAGSVFSKARFNRADFSNAIINGADFSRATLFQASFFACRGEKARFTGAEMKNSRADNQTVFDGSDFSQAIFAKSYWGGAYLRGCVFRNAVMDEANFTGSDMSGADLHLASAKDARFNKADLTRASLVGANLLYATLRRARLEETDFMNANLYGADVFRAVFRQTNIKGANTKQTLIDLKMV